MGDTPVPEVDQRFSKSFHPRFARSDKHDEAFQRAKRFSFFAAAGRKRRVSENEVPWRLLKFKGRVVPKRFSKFQMVKVILELEWLGLVFRQAIDRRTLLRN